MASLRLPMIPEAGHEAALTLMPMSIRSISPRLRLLKCHFHKVYDRITYTVVHHVVGPIVATHEAFPNVTNCCDAVL